MNKFLFTVIALFLFGVSSGAFAQDPKTELNFLTDIVGRKGVVLIIFIIVFAYSYRNSLKLFSWVEDQTFGTRDYVLQRCELLHIEIEPIRVTYILLVLSLGFSVIVFGACAFFGQFFLGLILAGIVSIAGWKIPRPFMNMLVNKRVTAYKSQMVDALQLLSNGLRAGLSLPQSLGMVVDELPNPVAQEFNTVLQQTKIGVPLEEAFENLVTRIPTQDNDMFVSAIGILKETGGNLSEVFDTIAAVIRERVRLQQKIDTFTAQGKFQGYTIFAMPFALGGIFASSDPGSMSKMFTTPIGLVLFFAALIMDCLGLWVIFKIVKIEV